MSKKRKKQWSKIIEEAGVRIRVYERPGSSSVFYSIIAEDGRKVRKSLKTGDRTLAEERARAIARSLAEVELTGGAIERITIGRLSQPPQDCHCEQLSLACRKPIGRDFGVIATVKADRESLWIDPQFVDRILLAMKALEAVDNKLFDASDMSRDRQLSKLTQGHLNTAGVIDNSKRILFIEVCFYPPLD